MRPYQHLIDVRVLATFAVSALNARKQPCTQAHVLDFLQTRLGFEVGPNALTRARVAGYISQKAESNGYARTAWRTTPEGDAVVHRVIHLSDRVQEVLDEA